MRIDTLAVARSATGLAAAFVLAVALAVAGPAQTAAADDPAASGEIAEIAMEAYVYAYPLVIMDASRRVMCNVEAVGDGTIHAPVNQFAHIREFPDATFTDVVRPNADTLYSSLWLDLAKEPIVIRVPDSKGRFYLLPVLDLWTDVFSSRGKRTSGTVAQTFAIAGPQWHGELPAGLDLIRAPTNICWMIGRTQTNGKADYAAVHAFQAGLTAVPLSAYASGKDYVPPKGTVDPTVSKSSPVEQVAKLSVAEFFGRFVELTKLNPPHANDDPILQRMKRIGIVPGLALDLGSASPEVNAALENAVANGPERIAGYVGKADRSVNGWSMIASPVGTYGTDYLKRALIARMGLGANVMEDAIYPTANARDGRALDSGKKYVLHFAKVQLPPVRAFWSLTMYDERQLFAENSIGRYAIGDRDALQFDAEGGLTLYVQRESPGGDKEANWLPAPKSGSFSMNLRLYWPQPQALDGTWEPPPVKTAD